MIQENDDFIHVGVKLTEDGPFVHLCNPVPGGATLCKESVKVCKGCFERLVKNTERTMEHIRKCESFGLELFNELIAHSKKENPLTATPQPTPDESGV